MTKDYIDIYVRMTILSGFTISSGLIAMGLIELLLPDNPLMANTKLCYNNQYSDCSYELRKNTPILPFNVYLIAGLTLLGVMYVLLHSNKAFNKVEVDN